MSHLLLPKCQLTNIQMINYILRYPIIFLKNRNFTIKNKIIKIQIKQYCTQTFQIKIYQLWKKVIIHWFITKITHYQMDSRRKLYQINLFQIDCSKIYANWASSKRFPLLSSLAIIIESKMIMWIKFKFQTFSKLNVTQKNWQLTKYEA